MITIGLDIGTSSISLAALESGGAVLRAETIPHASFLPDDWPRARRQDPEAIWSLASRGLRGMMDRYPRAAALGLTGQMHGILYVDREGSACSPLYTWENGLGDLPFEGGEGLSYAEELSRRTGYPMATGYGLTTFFYHAVNGLVPKDAAALCTIPDYFAMRLSGMSQPVMSPGNAAGLGLYSLEEGGFDLRALGLAGLDAALLPDVREGLLPGGNPWGLPVCAGIGDNQASFLGAALGRLDQAVINLGTGGQISAYSGRLARVPGLDTRPFPGGGYLLVGASLCGGGAYAMLERFFREVAEMVTGESQRPCYDAMARLLEQGMPDNCPKVDTAFRGTRQNPRLRGAITQIGADNLTPLHLAYGFLDGMLRELHQHYEQYVASCPQPSGLVGSGNAMRRNSRLQRMAGEMFGLPFTMSEYVEEAAIGAALHAARLVENAGGC